MWVDVTGTYLLRYTATDEVGNIAELEILIVIINGIEPALFLNGSNPLVVEVYSDIVDPGAYVVDKFGWTTVVLTNITDVDTSQLGRQTAIYWINGANPQGLTAVPIHRIVVIRDATPPVCVVMLLEPHHVVGIKASW